MTNTTSPRVLFWDIETAPLIGMTWGVYEQNVIHTIQEGYILCFAYKWQGESKVNFISIRDFPLYKTDPTNDKELCQAIWDLLDEADIAVAQNGDRFDIPYVTGRFVVHNLKLPSMPKLMDTLKMAKQAGRFHTNNLDDLCRRFGIPGKVHHSGFSMWLGCMDDNNKSWKEMEKYNKQDIVSLEALYNRLLPYCKSNPAVHLAIGDPDACPRCGSKSTMMKRGFCHTSVCTYQRYQCLDCGGYSRSRVAEKVSKPVYTI